MNGSQKNAHEKYKVIAFVTLVIFCICAGFCSYIIWHGRQEITAKISESEKNIRNVVKYAEKTSSNKYKSRIKSFLNTEVSPARENILKAFERQDREELFQLSEPFYNLFKKEDAFFSTIAWILPDNRVFLRVCRPKVFGDDVSVTRPDVVRANKDLQLNSGYMTAFAGLCFRIVLPVVYQGQYIGVVQFGLKDSFLIDMFQEQLGNVVIQVMPTSTFQSVKFSKLPSYVDGSFTAQSHDHDIDLIKSASPAIDWKLDRQRTVIQGKDYVVSKVFELSNYAGKPEGWLFTLIDISELTTGMRTTVIKIVSISIILLLLSSFIIFKSYNKLTEKISQLNDTLVQKNTNLEDQVTERTRKLTETNTALTTKIEEHKQAEAALIVEKDKAEGYFNIVGVMLIALNSAGKITLINPKGCEILNVTEDEALGKNWFKHYLPKRMVDDVMGVFNEIIAGKIEAVEYFENPVLPLDGVEKIIAFHNKIIVDKKGNIAGVLFSGEDITERKQAETSLQRSKKEWEETFDAMSDLITIQDMDMRIIRANKAAHDAFQVEFGELNGKYCYEFFRGANQPCSNCPELTALTEKRIHCANITHENLGKIFNVTTAPILDEHGSFTYIVHIAKDITDHKKLEAELFQAQKMEAIGTLAGGIAHDFNNILSAILGYSDLAKQDLPENSRAGDDIDQVIKSSNRAADLVKQILTFSRKADHQLHSLMPHLIVKEALKMLRSSLPTTLSLDEKIDPDCGSILADPTNIHQIVMNLCTNAFHSMENEKGTLAVSLCRKDIQAKDISESDVSPGPFVVLSVSDTGQGMDMGTIERIFEPYFTTKEVGKGTGLGLAVIHGIIKDYKGFIQVESELGKGSIFHVHFPVLEQVVLTHEITKEKPLSTGTERILVVDDESSIVNLQKTVLERLGYRVTATTSSKEALEKIRLHPDQFDLIITDQTMPDLSGVELAEEVLKIKPEMPIILCTGYSSVITEEGALAIGIKKYAPKPVNRSTLAKIVRQVLDDHQE